MKRRDFIRTAGVVGGAVGVGGAAGLGRLGAASTTGPGTEALGTQQVGPKLDLADRSPNRDPRAIQRSTISTDGCNNVSNEKFLSLAKAGGISCAVRPGGSVQGYANTYDFIDAHKDECAAATTVREIEEAHRQGKIAFVFHAQTPNFLNADIGYRPPSPLRAHYQLGLRIFGFVYNLTNMFGGGPFESQQIGLTRAGRRLVEHIHKLRILLDVGGHMGEATALDAIKVSAGVPVISSHTNPAALNDNPRCISDRLMEAIARTGGLVGISAFNDFLSRTRKDAHIKASPQVGLDKYMDHLDYVKKTIGVDHVGIASDQNLQQRQGGLADPLQMPPEGYSDTGDRFLYVKGFETPAEYPNVTHGLIQRGWSTEEIRKVLGENYMRVFRKVWGA